MATDIVAQLESLLASVAIHKQDARWELAENCLSDAEALCDLPRFPNADQARIRLQIEQAEVKRRHGKYEEAIEAQEKLAQSSKIDDIRRCTIYSELGINYRHTDRIQKAHATFDKQYDLAIILQFEREAEACKAAGDLALAKYQLYLSTRERELLDAAHHIQKTYIKNAQNLLGRIQSKPGTEVLSDSTLRTWWTNVSKTWSDRWKANLQSWLAIGLSRMVPLYIAIGEHAKAISCGEKAVEQSSHASCADPTVRALCRFMLGHAFLAEGKKQEALKHLDYRSSSDNSVMGVCTPVIALVKEPSTENRGYLKQVIDAGVDLNAFDEQGYSALDYAVYSNDARLIDLLRTGLVSQLGFAGAHEAFQTARLREHFREIFQHQFRPILQRGSLDDIHALRTGYIDLLRRSREKRAKFDWLRVVSYNKFVERGSLPFWTMVDEHLTTQLGNAHLSTGTAPFLVFISYRWIGMDTDPLNRAPDNATNFQYKRMLDALEQLLRKNNHIRHEDIYIWLDCACIDQDDQEPGRKERGINALPMIVAQCNATISLVDDQYYDRAWCAVETMIVQTLKESSPAYQWYEHVLLDKSSRQPYGMLQPGPIKGKDSRQPSKMDVSVSSDRRYIEFLERQSILLGKAGSSV